MRIACKHDIKLFVRKMIMDAGAQFPIPSDTLLQLVFVGDVHGLYGQFGSMLDEADHSVRSWLHVRLTPQRGKDFLPGVTDDGNYFFERDSLIQYCLLPYHAS